MKKVLSVFLALLISLTAVLPAFAESERTVPLHESGKEIVILISGDGDALYSADGKRLFKFTDFLSKSGDEEDDGSSDIMESVANVLLPFLTEGILFNKWDNYYKQLEKEVGEIADGIQLDENGEVTDGSGIAPDKKATNERNTTVDQKNSNGDYNSQSYHFWYDWRKDPLETADELHDYIKAVKSVTGKEKVGLFCRCLGGNVAAAYMAKYGNDDLSGVVFDGTVTNGAEFISESISGKFHVDSDAILRLLDDSEAIGRFSLSPFLKATIDVAMKAGLLDNVTTAFKLTVYKRIVEGVTSALALSTFFTMPCYWATVKPEDFETAKNYVFGKEGSEKRQKYAGLIAKLDNYQHTVRDNIDSLLTDLVDDGKNLGIISKYGYQIVPICQSCDVVSDQYASVTSSSFGATTSDIHSTLPEEYISKRVEEGKGRYISPDKQIDASTCLFPDMTWFTKGVPHSKWSWYENALTYTVLTSDRQLTVDDIIDAPQYCVSGNNGNDVVPMTEENADVYNWDTAPKPTGIKGFFERIRAFWRSFVNWFKLFREFLADKRAK